MQITEAGRAKVHTDEFVLGLIRKVRALEAEGADDHFVNMAIAGLVAAGLSGMPADYVGTPGEMDAFVASNFLEICREVKSIRPRIRALAAAIDAAQN